jgi:RNA polymerase sigma-70 factor (ECF subfamily)
MRDDAAAPVDPDAALLRRAGGGDRDACGELVRRHLHRVHRLAYRLLGDPGDAEDVAQEAFLRVWTEAARWREGSAPFAIWLHRVTQNLAIDRLRRRRAGSAGPLADLADGGAPAAARIDRAAADRAVRDAVATLPERQREAIALCHFEQRTNVEAAGLLGVSVDALESLLARGRRTLREQLAGWLDGEG